MSGQTPYPWCLMLKPRMFREVRKPMTTPELDVVLDDIEEYLDNLSDCEGNGPADARPNLEMRLLNALQEAREKAK